MQQQEAQLEQNLIDQLTTGESQWTFRDDLKTEDDLWNNFFTILEHNNRQVLDDVPLTDNEKASIKAKINHSTFFRAAQDFTGANGQYRIQIPRDDTTVGTISLLVIDHTNIAGGTSVYEVVHQIQMKRRQDMDNDRRGDVTLLINGLPVIHIELKAPGVSYLQAFNQIQKYITEQKFTGIFSNVQMFVVTNGTDTKYIAADQHLREKFLSGWVDKDNRPVTDCIEFAKDVLSIPAAHHMVADYSVLDSKQKHIILLRPYQIHAIEAIFEASKNNQSGFIWHTTGSGKTLTSYRVAHNLLSIPSLDKVIFLIDRKDLDSQTTQAFQAYANNDSIDVNETESTYELGKKLVDGNRTVLVTTRQKLHTLFSWQENARDEDKFKAIKNLKVAFIVDECHRTISSEKKNEIDKFFHIKPLWYGFTGTPIFAQNKKQEHGNAAQTTEQQYGPCLHSYTIKDAIRDHAVLGFQINEMNNIFQEVDDESKTDYLNAQYVSKPHMEAVAENVIDSCYRALGLYNINNRGYSYSAIFTTSPANRRPIEQAQRYYKLFKAIKEGKSDIKIPNRIKQILPDFPKFAITFSLSQNEQTSIKDQQFMKMALADYNKEYGTSYSLDEINAYNKNINDRLARKNDTFKAQSERLDFVIVVDRLLTGFDSQYLSTLFVDRPPMKPQDLIQAFSRTNRIFDKDKKYGNIITYQYPKTYNTAIDDALKLYSQGGIGDVIAPTWEQTKEKYDVAYHNVKSYLAQDELESLADESTSDEEKQKFIRTFQHFDKEYSDLQTYDEFDQLSEENGDYPANELMEQMQGVYEVVFDQLKKDKPDNDPEEPVDMDYRLASVINKSINYQYILGLIQAYVPEEGAEQAAAGEREAEEIENHIADLRKTNQPLADIISKLWDQIKQDPSQYAGQQVDQLLDKMVQHAYDEELAAFAEKYQLQLTELKFVIRHYDVHAESHSGVNTLLSRDAYNNFKAANPDSELKNMMAWKRTVRPALHDFYMNRIAPLLEK